MIKDLSQSLINAAAEINKATREKYYNEQAALREAQIAKSAKLKPVPVTKADPAAHAGAAAMANVKEEAVSEEGSTGNAFDWKNKKKDPDSQFDRKKVSTGTVYTRKHKKADEDDKKVDESMDTPGNSYEHQCAIHVKSESLGEGRTLTGQHAEPDAAGNIEWYDVMFAEGIRRVATKDVEVLESEHHKSHAKKMKKM